METTRIAACVLINQFNISDHTAGRVPHKYICKPEIKFTQIEMLSPVVIQPLNSYFCEPHGKQRKTQCNKSLSVCWKYVANTSCCGDFGLLSLSEGNGNEIGPPIFFEGTCPAVTTRL